MPRPGFLNNFLFLEKFYLLLNFKKIIMKRLIISTIVVCLFMLAAFGAFAQSEIDMKSFIKKANQEMIDLIKEEKYESLDKYYDVDAVSMPNFRPAENGYKLILSNNLARQKSGFKILDGEKTTTNLIVGEDMIVDIGTYSKKVLSPGMTEPRVDNGKYLNVWKKDKAGMWKLVAETWNADKSPNAPTVKGQPQPAGAPKPNPGVVPMEEKK